MAHALQRDPCACAFRCTTAHQPGPGLEAATNCTQLLTKKLIQTRTDAVCVAQSVRSGNKCSLIDQASDALKGSKRLMGGLQARPGGYARGSSWAACKQLSEPWSPKPCHGTNRQAAVTSHTTSHTNMCRMGNVKAISGAESLSQPRQPI